MRSFRFAFPLSGINRLEELSLTNCGEIENIGFIKLMKNLKVFVFIDTNVVDGDLSPCIGLRYSGFFDKKHYTHKFKQLTHAIVEQQGRLFSRFFFITTKWQYSCIRKS
ncbi:hypothetical protein ACFVRR_22775 [Gottfriedia sp. NPDC057948]|uniref:hypothetical protein n=1 Tax=Gottfriedia sp. NPDC057948 TaxID=3346287 RepID=UPI0036DD401F